MPIILKSLFFSSALFVCTAHATNVDVEKQFHGLDIDATVVGSSDSGGSGTVSGGGLKVLRVVNRSTSEIECDLVAGPAENTDNGPEKAVIGAGKQATLKLPADYGSAHSSVTLNCDRRQ